MNYGDEAVSFLRPRRSLGAPMADFFKVFGACALLLIAALIINWVRLGSKTMGGK